MATNISTENLFLEIRYCPKCWMSEKIFQKKCANLRNIPSFNSHVSKCNKLVDKMKNLVDVIQVGCQIINMN